MTKNEIVARFMGFCPVHKYPQAGVTEGPAHILIKNLKYDSDRNKMHSAWEKFRDLKIKDGVQKLIHEQYSDKIVFRKGNLIRHYELYNQIVDEIGTDKRFNVRVVDGTLFPEEIHKIVKQSLEV